MLLRYIVSKQSRLLAKLVLLRRQLPGIVGQRDLPLLPAALHRIIGFFDRLAEVVGQVGYVFVKRFRHTVLYLKVGISQR